MFLYFFPPENTHTVKSSIFKIICEYAPYKEATQPLKKLTRGLIHVYTGINEKYYAQKEKFNNHSEHR
jgi:hypothetical protein